ncbi:TetR/AcrR family transcriptional regulator [Chitinophaga varians]|uniref:TetR/AcrR family transcriptional regulator n=1 Tax=Chitinophaga varians TaxID=2202339 RepID=UPI00165F1D10|nr:TetR/AcrR family transcriptional regulator [Chitinophaga varians]MBC9914439.1 TetR/AcrR family transcriptional regulator [Chitinophaga varians]
MKDKIVSLADKLIRIKGFNAFSYKDIADPLAVKNAAVHYHFPSKADLGIAVVKEEMDRFQHNVQRWQELPEDEQLAHLFDVFRRHCYAGNVCLMGSLAPDYETLTPPMQDKINDMAEAIVEWVTAVLENGRNNKRFHFKGSAGDRALLVISNLQSSLLLARVMGPETFDRISRQLLEDLRS